MPQRFALGSIAAGDLKASAELARRFIEAMPLRSEIKLVQHDLTPLSGELRAWILERLAEYLQTATSHSQAEALATAKSTAHDDPG